MVKVGRVNNCTHYCGRAVAYKESYGIDCSIFGNPYFMKTESDRDSVCDAYTSYFWFSIKTNEQFRQTFIDLVKFAEKNDVVWVAFVHLKDVIVT